MLLNLIMYSLLTACLTWFVQYTLQPGEIFGRVGLLFTAIWMRNWRREDRWKRWWVKPAGQCPMCNGFWVFAVFWFIGGQYIFGYPLGVVLLLLPLGAGANYIWTKAFSKIVEW